MSRPVAGYEDKYEVTRDGEVRTVHHTVPCGKGRSRGVHPRTLRPCVINTGYLMVNLWRNQKQDKRLVHRLVAEAYVDGWFEGAEVDHIDGDRTNNSASNLRWVTSSENTIYANIRRG